MLLKGEESEQMDSFSKHLLNTSYVPDTVLGAGNI